MRLITPTVSLMLVAAAPALAEGMQKTTQSTQQMNQPQAPKSFQFLREQMPNQWSAEALIDRTVYNLSNDKLGEINNVILTEDGRVAAVTIGVGGFLGLGEKDVAVPFSALAFRAEGERNVSQRSQQQPAETKGDKQNLGTQTSQSPRGQSTSGDRHSAEHENVRVYLNATKDQLKDAPDFKWLSEKS